MGIARFERFQNVEIAGTQYLLVQKLSGQLWQLRDTRTNGIKEYTQSELHQMLLDKKLRFPFPIEKLGTSHHTELSEEEKAAIDRKMLYVNAVLDLPYTRPVFEQAIREAWENDKSPTRRPKPPGWITVREWKVRFLTFGRDKRALLDRNCLKGNREPRYSVIVEEVCLDSIDTVYLTRERNGVAETLLHAQAQVRAMQARLDREHERNPANGRQVLQIPSRRFLRSLLAMITEHEKYAARYSPQAARAKFRGVKGHIIADYPLERVELDSTQIDIYVVDEDGIPMGRPWVTACIDVHTRCALGIYLGFTPPSAEAAIACLKDAFMPKPWLRERYPDIRNDLPYGVMEDLIVDQAFENHSVQIGESCHWLGVEVHYMARKQPWMKGHIERFMRTVNDGIAHGFPGTTFRSIAEKSAGEYDPKKHAVVRLSFMRWAIRKWQADEYHQRPHSALAGICPAQVWEENIKPEEIPVPHDAKEFEVMMGRPERRKLTHAGVLMNHLFYNSADLVSLRMRVGATFWVDLRLDDDNLGHLFVLWGNEAYEVKALRLDYAEGLTRYQHRVRRKYQKEHHLPKNPDGWLIAHEELLQGYDAEAKRRHPQMPKGSARDRDEGEKTWVTDDERDPTPPKAKAAVASAGARTTHAEQFAASEHPQKQPVTKITDYPVIIKRPKGK
jgi:putative transposase